MKTNVCPIVRAKSAATMVVEAHAGNATFSGLTAMMTFSARPWGVVRAWATAAVTTPIGPAHAMLCVRRKGIAVRIFVRPARQMVFHSARSDVIISFVRFAGKRRGKD